jgi:hypothetical protein
MLEERQLGPSVVTLWERVVPQSIMTLLIQGAWDPAILAIPRDGGSETRMSTRLYKRPRLSQYSLMGTERE